jgi:hypothetical protein
MNNREISKQRANALKKIPLKGKSPCELKALLIQYSQGLGLALFNKYQSSPRITEFLPEVGDYQSLVHQACLKTVAVYDYFKWKDQGDLEAKARIEKWRNGHGNEFIPRRKHKFTHLGHLYGYMYFSADTSVRMCLQSLRLSKRFGLEVYASQLKTGDETYRSSTMDMLMGPADSRQLEEMLFHREITERLPNLRVFKGRSKNYTYQELYYYRYVAEYTFQKIGAEFGCDVTHIKVHIDRLNELLAKILRERKTA